MTTSFAHDSPQLAETYDRLGNSQFEGSKRLVDRLEIAEGAHVLDVGCGTGRLGRSGRAGSSASPHFQRSGWPRGASGRQKSAPK